MMAEEFTGPVVVTGRLNVEPFVVNMPVPGQQGIGIRVGPGGAEIDPGEISCEFLNVTGKRKGASAASFTSVSIGGKLNVAKRVTFAKGIHVETGDIVLGKGDLQLFGADCAEDFDVHEGVDSSPGSVMVIGAEGALEPCSAAYDSRAVGIVSGAGPFRPAVRLDSAKSERRRAPIGLVGKVFCKVDAHFAEIEAGDLLTTSATVGHAMKATDRGAAIGATVGKALAPLPSGRGLIPILIVLQ